MRRIYFIIALFTVLLLTSSGFNESKFGSAPGKTAAPMVLNRDDVRVSLNDLRGRYVLVSFWSALDAQSRVLCNRYDGWMSRLDNTDRPIHLSVNLDEDISLWKAIVRADGMDEQAQFNVNGKAAEKIRKDYNLEKACGTILIGPDGRVAAVNPTQAQLSSF